METSGWSTHCFGRFLIDLPPQARVNASYRLRGDEIKHLSGTPDSLRELIDVREQELKNQKHEIEGSMFIRRVSHEGGSISLLSWTSPRRKLLKFEDTYLVATNAWSAFHYSGELSAERESIAVRNAENFARSIRFRAPDEIPTEPGFCIDGGYIAGSEYMVEAFDIGFTMPEHPGMHFSIGASTGAEEDSLLDRVGGFLRTEVLGAAMGLKTLRKGRRPVGPLRGEEYATAASDKGQRVYAFMWEFQGRDNSLGEPNINAGLSVLERDPDDDGNPPPPAFESDEQALQLWDAVIDSIRLRPGAI